MVVRAVLVVCLMLVSVIAGARAEEQKTTVSYDYECSDLGGDGFSNLHCNFIFHLKGTINNVMLQKFRLALAEVPTSRKVNLSVDIDSPGGSIRDAMEIGRIMRQREMEVRVTPKMSCASACVLLFAAGVSRDIYENPFARFVEAKSSEPSGAIGIHRPYIAETPQQPVTYAEVKQQTDQTTAELRSYLQEMGVSGRLADDMMAVPSTDMRWLTPSELESYGLVATDPVWWETQQLNAAQTLGLSPVEYMKREALARQICFGTPNAPAGCYPRVLQTGR